MRDPYSTTLGVPRLGSRSFVAFVAFGWLLWMGFAPSASATTLTAWEFAPSAGSELSVNGTPLLPAFQVTEIKRGGTTDRNLNPIADSFSNGAWPSNRSPLPINDPLNTDGYFEFSINPASGTIYSLTDIRFNIVSLKDDGVNSWYLKSDADLFAADLDSFFSNFATAFTHTSTLSGFQNLTGARTFRLYAFGGTGGAAGLGGAGNDVIINGELMSAQSVPETLPFGVFGLTAAALFWVRSRIKS